MLGTAAPFPHGPSRDDPDVIARPRWKEWFKTFVDGKIAELSEETIGLSNGLRIASNWALNALGFYLFLSYLGKLRVID